MATDRHLTLHIKTAPLRPESWERSNTFNFISSHHSDDKSCCSWFVLSDRRNPSMLLHQFRSRLLDRENLWWLLCVMFGPKPLYFAAADDAQTIHPLTWKMEAKPARVYTMSSLSLLYSVQRLTFFIALQPPWQATLPPTSFSPCA